jgi:hypothetical protein
MSTAQPTPKIALIFEEESPFSTLNERQHRNQILYFPNYQEFRSATIVLVGQWGLIGLCIKGREANRRVIPGHSQIRQKRQ